MSRSHAKNPLRAGLRREQGAEPCSIVIFGGSGDLTHRKLIPALYNLHVDRLLPGSLAIVGVARKEVAQARYVAELRQGVETHSRRELDEKTWSEISAGLPAAKDGGVPRFETESRGVDGHIRTGLEDDGDHADRNSHLGDLKPVGTTPRVENFADRIG